jgi:acetoin utilization deacetylase AcuC-like enzyme
VRFFFHADYVAPIPASSRFPMSKYETTRAALASAGVAFDAPEPAARDHLLLAHRADYADAVLAADVAPAIARRIGFPVTQAVARRALLSVGGTIAAARAALADGFAANVAGGSHHAMPDGGAGYCVLNDLAVAALLMLREGAVRRILILDLDVHQGDGTVACLNGVEGAFAFSIHAEKNFPVRKLSGWRDIALPDGTGDRAYLEALGAALPGLFDAARPDLVLVQAGVDPHGNDRLGRLALSDAGLIAREALVRDRCQAHGVPFAATLGGGYDPDVEALGRRHARSLLTLAGRPFSAALAPPIFPVGPAQKHA